MPMKANGGAVGLTENPTALRCWMVSGPEMARVMEQFEITTEKRKSNDVRHHEQTKHAQNLFARNVKAPTAVIEDMGIHSMRKAATFWHWTVET